MADERESRALAAGRTIEVEGVEYRLRPITVQHLCDLEEDALDNFKRQYLKTFRDNADLLGDDAKELLVKKVDEVGRWSISDLPQKDAYDTGRVPVTAKVRKWVAENWEEVPETDVGIRALLANALDTGRITARGLERLAGKRPLHGRVRYDQWWVTASMNGQIAFIVSSVRYDHPKVTKREVRNWPLVKITEAARIVESLSSAAMGNT